MILSLKHSFRCKNVYLISYNKNWMCNIPSQIVETFYKRVRRIWNYIFNWKSSLKRITQLNKYWLVIIVNAQNPIKRQVHKVFFQTSSRPVKFYYKYFNVVQRRQNYRKILINFNKIMNNKSASSKNLVH